MIFTGITRRIRKTGHLSKTKIDFMMSKLWLSKTYMYCLDLSIYSVLSILWGSIEDTSITSLYWKRKRDNWVHCNLEFATAVVCEIYFVTWYYLLYFLCHCVFKRRHHSVTQLQGEHVPLSEILAFFSLLIIYSLSNKNRIKNSLRRVTWCGFVVGQKKFTGQNGFRLGQ